jgi:RimJ/RimL family protein N-acetyltransferase
MSEGTNLEDRPSAPNPDSILEAPPMKIIETERLRLRTLQMSDVEAITPIISHPDVMKWT